MTPAAASSRPPAPPAPTLNRCVSCHWYTPQTAEAGLCYAHDTSVRADAVACPQWRRRSFRLVTRVVQ